MDPELMEDILHRQAFDLVLKCIWLIRDRMESIPDATDQVYAHELMVPVWEHVFNDLIAFEREWRNRL